MLFAKVAAELSLIVAVTIPVPFRESRSLSFAVVNVPLSTVASQLEGLVIVAPVLIVTTFVSVPVIAVTRAASTAMSVALSIAIKSVAETVPAET